jgi:hypothetical protein
MELMRGHHSVGEANLHLQFTPKYRRDVFRDEVVQRVCEEGFRETARTLGLVIHALAFGPDHVHVFVGPCKNHSVRGRDRPTTQGRIVQGNTPVVLGPGQDEAVGRCLLAWGILLSVHGLHDRRGYPVRHPAQPAEALDRLGL